MGRRGNSEGSIYQRRSDGKWCGAISLPGAKRKVFYAKTRREVVTQLREAQRRAEYGTLESGRDQTLGNYLKDWLENCVRTTLKPRSWESYEERVRLHVLPDLGHVRLRKLTPQHLQRLYAQKLADGLASTTVNHVHFVISSALTQAMRWELVPRNVASLVDPPRRLPADPRPLSSDTLAKLLDALEGHRHENMWTLMLGAGLRFGEAAGLTWEDIGFEAATVTVRHTLSRVRGGHRSWPSRRHRRANERCPFQRSPLAPCVSSVSGYEKHNCWQAADGRPTITSSRIREGRRCVKHTSWRRSTRCWRGPDSQGIACRTSVAPTLRTWSR